MSTAPRFVEPAVMDRPPKAHRFDVYSPKLGRQVTLFGRDALDLWTTLEGSPQVLSFCERPMKIPGASRHRCFDFWARRADREELLVLLRESERKEANPNSRHEILAKLDGTTLDGALIRCLDPAHMADHAIALANWGSIIRDLSAFERFVPQALCKDLVAAIEQPKSIRQLQEDFAPCDSTTIRIGIYLLLHRGQATCRQIATHVLGPEHIIEAP
jgi:hypothetical protein